MLVEFLVLLAIGAVFFYRWATKNDDFFEKRNMAHDKPCFLLGSGKDVILRRTNVLEMICEVYQRHNGIVYGVFDNRDPVILIREPELIKRVLIKDHEHFFNRRSFLVGSPENMIANTIFMMENDRWRDMRSTLSPAFTGSKMRQMFQLILQCVQEAMSYLREQHINAGAEGFELDMRDFTTRLTNDIIASTAFGLQINSYRDRDNEFYDKARKAINFSTLQQMKIMFIMLMPKVAEFFKIEFFERSYTDYFMRLVLDAMKYRQEHNIHRPDMINLLMEARGMIPSEAPKTHFRQWSDIEVVAQCFIFFAAGFDTSSSVMNFAAHELMENPHIQQRLYEEISKEDEELEGKSISYEALQRMPYLDMVVSEVLRKWPVALAVDRVCNKDYEYESQATGERIEIKKGDMIRVAMAGIQRDAKYYENPEEFNPERFSAENKSQIDAGIYMPFGLGPRNCIGNRFALLEIKAYLYYLLRDYRLDASPKTCTPLELDKTTIQLRPKNGFWLQLKPRFV
ncbi:probable cytochrome P450 9f2 [Stomoxys calcitrans]|uniref:probable cytochrome P450 9f2 n=1 Tax=Stomoxys calcitrans TaxID=35570 RepID=UPI0027E29321|nr:probable cytochrome P450 9f2 [Stomoxys calcitrans]